MVAISISVENINFWETWLAIGVESIYVSKRKSWKASGLSMPNIEKITHHCGANH
jgi:hypothetical protein